MFEQEGDVDPASVRGRDAGRPKEMGRHAVQLLPGAGLKIIAAEVGLGAVVVDGLAVLVEEDALQHVGVLRQLAHPGLVGDDLALHADDVEAGAVLWTKGS